MRATRHEATTGHTPHAATIGHARRAVLAGLAALGGLAMLGGLTAGGAGAARAQTAPAPATRQRIEGVIEGQIDAFRRDDLAAAFGFASPAIRDLFGTPENFGRMVRQGYPMVWRPGGWRFSTLEPEGEGLRQTVILTDSAGVPHVAEYSMRLVDGEWKINGVRLRPPVETGA